MQFTIVSSAEITGLENAVSEKSPVGASLLGQSVHDEVEIDTPSGTMHVVITNIE